jgi:ATPase subunit of ABC transporter with duplicated ATPase domains
VPGLFVQTHARPDLADRWPEEILMTEHALLRSEAMAALARYEIQFSARQPFRTLSGGQQARLQILLLELAGSTLLLLDEPTDNLDLSSAEALQEGMEFYQGTVRAPAAGPSAVVGPVPGVPCGRKRAGIRQPGVGRDSAGRPN